MDVTGKSYPIQSLRCGRRSPLLSFVGYSIPSQGQWNFRRRLTQNVPNVVGPHWSTIQYICCNEQWLVNNNSLILLKLRGTHPGGECLPTQTLRWSLENVLRSLPYRGLEGTLQKHGLFPLLLPTKHSFSVITHWQHCTFKGVLMTYDGIDLCMMTLAFV